MMTRIEAPFSAEQVLALNNYQVRGLLHPFTCGSGNRMDGAHRAARLAEDAKDYGLLIAAEDGWFCPACKYRQTWAHAFMTDPAHSRP